MASLKIVSDRCDDNAILLRVSIPPRRNGDPNFAALQRVMQEVMTVNPDAFDPVEPANGRTVDDGGIVAHDIAAARLRDLERDDDEGAPGEEAGFKRQFDLAYVNGRFYMAKDSVAWGSSGADDFPVESLGREKAP